MTGPKIPGPNGSEFTIIDKWGWQLAVGHKVVTLRGVEYTIEAVATRPKPGTSARIKTSGGTFYAAQFNLTVKEIAP